MNPVRRMLGLCFVSVAAFGQSPASVPASPRLEFEVASIKPAPPPAPGQINLGIHVDGAMVRCTDLSLKDYIRIAFRIKDYQVIGPEWIGSERYDISAKLPEGGKREQVDDMLQTLLVDRFRIEMHHDSKEFPVYALTVAKGGLKMKESPIDPDAGTSNGGKGAVNVDVSAGRGSGATVAYGNGSYFMLGEDEVEGKKLTMLYLADMLSRFAERPVVDMTDVKGAYDFKLEFPHDEFRAMTVRAAISAGMVLPPQARQWAATIGDDALFTAVQTVGLKLDSRKAPLDVLVIDQAQKTPSEN
jgi:uncharacterized protein (TIGR03435 family)